MGNAIAEVTLAVETLKTERTTSCDDFRQLLQTLKHSLATRVWQMA